MGVRLYPNTTNEAKLEVLAGVPAGTYARLKEMEARHEEEKKDPNFNMYEQGYEQWKEKNGDGPIGDLDAFLTFGWGKFRSPPGIAEDYSGSLEVEDHDKIRGLFLRNGISADPFFCEGVHWC